MEEVNRDLMINSCEFSKVVNKLRTFFLDKGFLEVHTQNRLSILAACEDPTTINKYNWEDNVWPLPQTGQMWLEYEMLKNPQYPGFFCVSTSFRNEPNPIPGRHNKIFPMFEYEMKGNMEDMMVMQRELLEYLGYGAKESFPGGNYLDVAKHYNVAELEHEHEQELYKEKGSVFFLKNFPNYTSPFWNMKRSDNQNADAPKSESISNKVDVIMSGQETIGSAERSCDPKEMRHEFTTISNGMYAKTIYNHFGKDRVDKEMEEFLNLEFFPRSGGGIGVTRLIRSMKMEGLL